MFASSVAGANVAKGCSMPDNRKLYISDWHYGHQNILAFDSRPFKTVEDMNTALIERWNSLIKGNHDRCNDGRFLKKFVKVTEYLEVEDAGRKVVLCHYPIPCFKNHYYGWYHLYGHVHSSFEWNMMERNRYLMQELYGIPCHMYNVGAMMPWMDYTPRTLDKIRGYNEHQD